MTFKPKILVVDDEPQMLELLGEFLRQAGAEPHCIQSSREAAERVNQTKFDGVFLDWLMPELDGLELARQIRWSKSNSLCPLVMISANPEPDGIKQCFQVGINFFLPKPVSKEQVRQLLTASWDLMLQERLRYHRVPLAVPVRGNWRIQDFQQEGKGESLNLSTTGMLLTLDPIPAPGDLIRLRFTLPGDPKPLLVDAFIVRLPSRSQVGVRFVNLAREDRWRLLNHTKASLGFSETSS